MTDRPLAAPAATYLAALIQNLEDRARSDGDLQPFVHALRSVDTTQQSRGPSSVLDHPAMEHLAIALQNAKGDPTLVESAVEAGHALDWSQLYGGGGMDAAIAERMLAAQVAGSYGCFPSDTVATGQFLLAPGLHYPLHTHAATELYYCVSGTLTLQHGINGEQFDVHAGDYSITPSNTLHGLWTGEAPTLLLYVWIDEISAPIWVWEKDRESGWKRSAWKRPPGQPWQIDKTESVTTEMLKAAGG